jgi:DNA-binding beta-propeller fold protein YncE
MGRLTRAVVVGAVAVAGVSLGGCGEPLVVLGDAPGLMRIVLGVGDSIGTRVDSIATRTRLTQPRAVAFNPANTTLYVADRGALRQVSGTTTPVARIFSVTSSGRSTLLLDAGGCIQNVCLQEPTAMAVAADGTLIIADAVGSRIFRYAPGGALTVLAGTGVAASSADGQPAATSPVNRPAGVAVGADGRIYFSESIANRVRAFQPGGTLTTIAGTGVRSTTGDGGPATQATLSEPHGLAFHAGVLYVAESGGHVVRAIQPGGTISTVAGLAGGAGFSGDDGPAVQARLSRPYAVAVSSNGRALFISDRDNDRVRVVDLVTGVIRTFAGTGDPRFNGNRLSAGQTSLDEPLGVDASYAGFIFIVDSGHFVVWRTSFSLE